MIEVDANLVIAELRSIANELTYQLAVAGARISALQKELEDKVAELEKK